MSTKKAAAAAVQSAAKIPSKITKNCTLAQLRAEASFRGLDLGTVPLSKAHLLEILGDGSTSSKAAAEKADKKVAPAAKKKAASAAASKKKEATTKKTTTGTKKSTTTTTATATKKKQEISKSVAPAKKKEATAAKKPAAASSKTTTNKKGSRSPTRKKSLEQPSPSKQTKLTSMLTVKKESQTKATKTTAAGLEKKHKNVAPNAASKASEPTRKKAKTEPVMSSSSKVAIKPPPAKKATTVTSAAKASTPVPRISKKLTLAQLKEEVVARGLQNNKNLPKTKADLLHFMVDGSIHVAESVEYKQYQNLLKRIEEERPRLYQQSLANREAEYEKQEQRRLQKAEKERLAREAKRTSEINNQEQLHCHSFPHVHLHLLARTSELSVNGNPRSHTSRCDLCDNGGYVFYEPERGIYTCEKCDWDICADCFQYQNMTPIERREKEEKERIEQAKCRREQERRQKLYEEEERQREAEEELRWNAKKQFAADIIKPSTTNKTLDAKGYKYVVWCSDGYGNDGWHSYNPPPDQHFDTCWKTAKEANDRARYLFFWKNSYGMDPAELSDDHNGDPQPHFREGLVNYSVEPADSTCWSVGVVPAAAFRHLPQATLERHNFDDERVPERRMHSYYGSFF